MKMDGDDSMSPIDSAPKAATESSIFAKAP
jgi:hypothetical protein